jgi:hypothetical protein
MKVLNKIFLLIIYVNAFCQHDGNKIPDYKNERIDYVIKYGLVKIGYAQLGFSTHKECSQVYIFAEAKSCPWLTLFFDIKYRYESCMDTLSGLPIYDSRILIEDDYVDKNTSYYFRDNSDDFCIIYSDKTDSIKAPYITYDYLTSIYHFRANYINDKLPKFYKKNYTMFFIDEVRKLNFTYHGITEIKTIHGKIECLIIKPETLVGHFFNSNEAMTIWVSNDGNYIPYRFCLKLKLGTIQGELLNYRKQH